MKDAYFNNIVEFLNNDTLENVIQGLALLETLLNDSGSSHWSTICEVEAIFKTMRHDSYDDAYPSWLRKAPFRQYVGLWILGYRARAKDPAALAVTEIHLNEPAFNSLPFMLTHLSSLKHFHLNRSNWTSIDDIWDKFPNLVTLDLFDNELQSLPNSVGRSTSLRRIRISSNPMTEFPPCLRNLKQLEYLSIRYTKFTALPEWIGELVGLTELNMESANVAVLPDGIGELSQLETLNLGHSAIEVIPDSIGKIRSLRSFQLWACRKLTYLPETLRTVSCGEAQIVPFWDVFKKMKDLEIVYISKSNHRDPECLAFENGEEIDFGWWPKLQSLSFQGGNFNLDTLSSCSELAYFQVARDQTQLPSTLGELKQLKELNLRGSKVSSLPESIGQLENLEKIIFHWDKKVMDPNNEVDKLRDLLAQNKGVDTTIQWQLTIENATIYGIKEMRERLTAQQFTSLKGTEFLEKLSVRLDAETPFPDISHCQYLDSISIHSDGSIPLSHLEKCSVGPCLTHLHITAETDVFPAELLGNVLGNARIEKGVLHFERHVSTSTQWSSELMSLQLQIAKNQGVLEQITYVKYSGTEIPPLVAEMTGLQTLVCAKVPCREFPVAVLQLPNLKSVSGADTDYPNEWPIRKVTYATLKQFTSAHKKYSNLQRLSVKGVMMKQIPEAVLSLKMLKKIDLSFNRLNELPRDLSQWSQLEEINLIGNPLRELPQSLLELPNLATVYLPTGISQAEMQELYPNIIFLKHTQ